MTDEVWNDRVFGNNVLSNWFDGIQDMEFAQICALPGKPLNRTCRRYFQVTDSMMLKSLFGKKAGKSFQMSYQEMIDSPQTQSYITASRFYSFMKRISGTPVRLAREFLWSVGRYDKSALREFIEDFNPDVVFCPRLSTWKLMRLEKIVSKLTDAPFVGFTADDEASFNEYSWDPLYWINRYIFHAAFKKHLNLFRRYLTFSEDQSEEYREEYNISTGQLYKCGSFPDVFESKEHTNPIKMVYAGRLYCNRWKSLAQIGLALREINKEETRIILDVYTQEKLTNEQKKCLNSDCFINVRGSVTPDELKEVYLNADIALHVESLDKRNRLLTRTSFSTKIIDLMASSCAIMAVCWKEHTGYKYLQKYDAAFCIDSYEDIMPILKQIADTPSLINDYAFKAWKCGKSNHSKELIQAQIRREFDSVIRK